MDDENFSDTEKNVDESQFDKVNDEWQPLQSQSSMKMKTKPIRKPALRVEATWDAVDVYPFISAVEQRPSIWDFSCSDYSLTNIREAAWRSVAAEIGRDVNDCKAKWKNLRTTQRKTKKNLETKSGQATENRQPTWEFWNAMMFVNANESANNTMSESNLVGVIDLIGLVQIESIDISFCSELWRRRK